VITGGIGICHLFVDEDVDIEKALKLIHNAKTQRPTVCNALDTLLVHKKIAARFLPKVVEFLEKSNVALRLDKDAWQVMGLSFSNQSEMLKLACPNDWDQEWLSLILGIKVVDGLDAAIAHIDKHSTGHSDGILTNNKNNASRFLKEVDSAAVYVNASTRFTDGGQLGLGAEVAISTQKVHARGPMGLNELTSYKWVISGDYHIRN
jgi:glutamate-5-semialdehyde dehydrogenase